MTPVLGIHDENCGQQMTSYQWAQNQTKATDNKNKNNNDDNHNFNIDVHEGHDWAVSGGSEWLD